MGQAGQAAGRKRRPARTGVGGGLTPTWWGQEPGSELERRPLPPPLLSGTVHDPPASGVQCLRGFRVAQGSQIGMNVPHSSQQAPHAVSIPCPPGSRRQLPAPTHGSVSPSSPSLLCTPAGSAREAARGRKEPERLSEGLLLQKKTRKLDGSWKNQKDEGPWEETASGSQAAQPRSLGACTQACDETTPWAGSPGPGALRSCGAPTGEDRQEAGWPAASEHLWEGTEHGGDGSLGEAAPTPRQN